MTDPAQTSVKPYLIRAWHEWCTDNGYTPHLLVSVDGTVAVPREFVQDGEIVLNVGMDATGALHLGNDAVRFKARFSGKVRDIMVPVERVQAIYARENGQGMGFEVTEVAAATPPAASEPVEPGEAAPGAGLSVVARTSAGVGVSSTEPLDELQDTGAMEPADASDLASSNTEPAPSAKGSTLRVVK